MKIAIIGGGFCGIAVVWHLLNHFPPFPNLNVHLFDSKEIGQSVSGIAAGLLHPFSGAHAKLNWRGEEGFQATMELLKVATLDLDQSVIAQNQGILRLALSEEQRYDFQQCTQKYPNDTQWLDHLESQKIAPGCASVPGLWIKKGITVFASLYLKGLWNACLRRGARFKKQHITSLKEIQNYDITIITAGSETTNFPELSFLPLKKVKGQVLELAWPQHIKPLNCALNSHAYLVMTEKKTCLVGATYERGFQDGLVNIEMAKKEILPKVVEMFPPLEKSIILNCFAGIRSVAQQHHPLIKRMSPSLWLLSGMGSKGLLYHALFARELVENIWLEFYN